MKSEAQKNLEKLPAYCAAILPGYGTPIIIVAGERGYHPAPLNLNVEAYNAKRGITPAQAEAMLVGSMFGWEVPGANPENCEGIF